MTTGRLTIAAGDLAAWAEARLHAASGLPTDVSYDATEGIRLIGEVRAAMGPRFHCNTCRREVELCETRWWEHFGLAVHVQCGNSLGGSYLDDRERAKGDVLLADGRRDDERCPTCDHLTIEHSWLDRECPT